MIIEQIIKFELKGSRSTCRICTPIPGYFHDKQKSWKQILKRLLTAKDIAGGNVSCFSNLGQVT